MNVLRLTLEGDLTSFRYPLTMVGRQLSYDMPPPTTIYGHVCSALGEWVDPRSFQFAYTFTFAARFDDLEHVHALKITSGKLPNTTLPKSVEGEINPHRRELLFRPRLTLYLTRPDWLDAFRSPAYPVVLGRSQDLCAYTDVRVVTLRQQPRAYFEHTLIPFEYPLKFPQGIVVNMPKWLDPAKNRAPRFARYVVLRQRVAADDERLIAFGTPPDSFWVDPDSPSDDQGRQRALVFHQWEETDVNA